jgi:hypothetical protein
MGDKWCAEQLGRTVNAIKVKCVKLRIAAKNKKSVWSKHEEEYLTEQVKHGKGCAEIAESLNRTLRSVQHRFGELGLQKPQLQVGDKIERLLILELYTKFRHNQNKTYAKCLCDCGKETHVLRASLQSGKIKSCGCLKAEKARERMSKQNYSHGNSKTRLYSLWGGMKTRCTNKNIKEYPLYGGRGIIFYKEWEDFVVFEKWAMSNGYADGLSLDRIDVNGNYEPNNCRWIPRGEQNRNKRSNVNITAFGETKTLVEWSEDDRCNTTYYSLQYRIQVGWEPELAISSVLYGDVIYKKENRKPCNYNYDRIPRTQHGMTGTRIYRIWIAMRRRCNKPNYIRYKDYGGRGISVCKDWNDSFVPFYDWAMSNGYKETLSIDRINVNGNYEPSNCRWATATEQLEHKR